MAYGRYWIKVVGAGVVAVGAATALVAMTRPPAMTEVGVLTEAIPAMHAIPTTAVHWTEVASPPPEAITPKMTWGSLVASQALAPGTILTSTDFATPQENGLKPGEVQWLVPVSAASSGLPTVGQRVDVWSNNNNNYTIVAEGVRVIGLYSSGGGPVATGSTTDPNASGPGMVSLAVPQPDIASLLNIKSPYLINDPNQSQFQLMTGTASTPTSSSKTSAPPAKAPTKASGKSSAKLPSANGG